MRAALRRGRNLWTATSSAGVFDGERLNGGFLHTVRLRIFIHRSAVCAGFSSCLSSCAFSCARVKRWLMGAVLALGDPRHAVESVYLKGGLPASA